MKNTLTLLPLILCFSLLTGYNFMNAQWSAPTGIAPSNNAAAPINVSSTTQAKSGNLAANILAATTETRTDRYCDSLGNSCWSHASATAVINGGGSGIKSYDSGWITSWTMTTDGIKVNHGLGQTPDLVVIQARARVANSVWAAGDILQLVSWGSDYDNNNENWGTRISDTSIGLSVGVGIQGYASSVRPDWADIRIKAYVFE